MLVIPAIDIHNGKCVRLFQGDFAQVTEYSDDPVEMAVKWIDMCAPMLHIVDLDGAKEGKPVHLDIAARIAAEAHRRCVPVQLGGGYRTERDVESALACGVDRVLLGTAACERPDIVRELVQRFGDKIVVSIDCSAGKVMTRAWLGCSEYKGAQLARDMQRLGVTQFVFTDVSRDGTLNGVNLEAVTEIIGTGASVIVAGGVGSIQDLVELKNMKSPGVAGAIIGRALYTGAIELEEALEVARNRAGKRIIPCLDTKDGRVVKGVKFTSLKNAGDPVELAVIYGKEGADELVLLDISASVEARATALDVVRRVSAAVSIPVTVGGGIANLQQAQSVMQAGATKVCINTAAVRDPDLIASASAAFGRERIVVAIDAAAIAVPATTKVAGAEMGTSADASASVGRWQVCVAGGRERTNIDLVEWAKVVERQGAGEILLTSVDNDGGTDGYDLPQVRAVTQAVSIPVIASGGAGSLEHFHHVLTQAGADAALAASVFHFGKLSVRQVKAYLAQKGVDVAL